MVERGEEEEETRTDRRTDGPTDSPSLSSAASDPLIFRPHLFSLVTSSPGLPFALHREKMRELVSLPLTKIRDEKETRLPGELGEDSIIILPSSFPSLFLSFSFSLIILVIYTPSKLRKMHSTQVDAYGYFPTSTLLRCCH